MEEPILSKELIDAFRPIVEMNNAHFRQVKTMLADAGFDWKEKVVGFLHDASEDCNVTVEDVMNLLDEEISRILDNPKENWWEEDWWEDWMEDIDKYPCERTHVMTDEEREEIKAALTLLNHHTASSREEYITRIMGNRLALKVKLNDLNSNMDITRIPKPTEKDYARLQRYKKEYQILMEALHNSINDD